MNASSAVLALLALCSLVLAMAQGAELRRGVLSAMVLGLAAALVLTGAWASHTSLAEVGAWASDARRRLDLSALLLGEALVHGGQAVALAQGRAGRGWRLLGALPAPFLLMTLFFAQVLVMLSIDGVGYGLVSWACALAFALLFFSGACLLRRALPDVLMRTSVRLVVHAVQAGAGLWLARPVAIGTGVADPVPAGGDGLLILAGIAAGLACVGWALQRRSILES